MVSKRSNITTVSAKASMEKDRIGTSARRKASTTSIDIGEIREGHLRLVIKGVVVPKPPARPVVGKKRTRPV